MAALFVGGGQSRPQPGMKFVNPPGQPMPFPLEQFVRQLVESGVMSADEIREFQARLPAAMLHPDDAQEFARELIRQRKLTAYQATAIYQGKGQGLVFGTYVVLDKLGQGGMGMVFRAEHRRMKRVVALKVMSAAAMKAPEAVKRFHREVEAAAKLTHPNIVAAHDADEARGVHYLVMEYVEGSDLSALVKKTGPLPVGKAVQYIVQAARGLEHAHREGVVHRDIKPANLLLDRNGTVKILDMGLARLTDAASGAAVAGLTQSGSIMGTVDYMSPEQALDTKHADARSDIYSLGCSLYYLLVGRAVYDGDTLMKKLLAHRELPVPSLRAERSDVPAALDAVFQKLVAKKPAERYASMSDALRDLEACLAGGVVSASASSPGGALPSPFQSAGSGTMGSDDPDVQEFLKAISPAATATNVRTRAGTAPAPETMASRVEEHTQLTAGHSSTPKRWLRVSSRQWWLVGGAIAGVLILASALWSLRRGKPENPQEVSTPAPQAASEKKGWQGWPADAPPPAIAPFDAGQARKHQQEWSDYLNLPVEYTNTIGMKFVLTPPGEFMMGSTTVEIEEALAVAVTDRLWQDCIRSEDPQHKVMLTQPIYLGMHEVTQKDYTTVIGNNPSYFATTGPDPQHVEKVAGLDSANHPVENVSWNDAAEFCDRLSRREDLTPSYVRLGETVASKAESGYRLPTEAEWEFACRAGTTAKFWIGDTDEELLHTAWFAKDSGVRTHVVGELKPNPFGAFDTHGNVWEWVEDQWEPAYYKQFADTPAVDPRNTSSTDSRRLFRGGHWDYPASACRSSGRLASESTDRFVGVGFRVVLPVARSRDLARHAGKSGGAIESAARREEFAFQKWLEQVKPRPPVELVVAVEKKLKELNPQFDGPFKPEFGEGGAVTGLSFDSHDVTNISPLRALSNLQVLSCQDPTRQSQLADLSPLRGLSLVRFDCLGTRVADLSPLAGMPLAYLSIVGTQVQDLSPLAGMPLAQLNLTHAPVADLSPLKGLPLKILEGSTATVSDLSPLEGLPLELLNLAGFRATDISALRKIPTLQVLFLEGTLVSDLSPLAGLKLGCLRVQGSPVRDFSPLRDLPLTELIGDFDAARDFDIIRAITSLETINGKPAAEFWKEALAEQSDLEAWTRKVASLPAEQQVQAVAAKLYDCNRKFDVAMTPTITGDVVTGLEFFTDTITDISPVRALKGLTALACRGSEPGQGRLADLRPLQGLALTSLNCSDNPITDLSALGDLPLTELRMTGTRVASLAALERLPLVHFTGKFDVERDAASLRAIKTLQTINGEPAAQALNDATDRKAAFEVWKKQVAGLDAEEQVRAVVAKLQELNPDYDGKSTHYAGNGIVTEFQFFTDHVSDISPVQALTGLIKLRLDAHPFSETEAPLWDLSPLAGLPLQDLSVWNTKVTDLTPLSKLKLTTLVVMGCHKLWDLSPLVGMPLTSLSCGGYTRVTDLSPLRTLPLTKLDCSYIQVTDLSPLADLRLTWLNCGGSGVRNLEPIRNMPLQSLNCNFEAGRDAAVLRSIRTLQTINDKPAADFWKEVAAQEAGTK